MIENISTFSQTLIRELPKFRAHCCRVFTQYDEIRHFRDKLKPMTEATCLTGGLCKCVDEIASYDKAQISIHPMVLHYRDEDGYMKVLSFVGLSGIMVNPVPSIFAFLNAMILELHQTMPLLKSSILWPTVQVLNTEIDRCALWLARPN